MNISSRSRPGQKGVVATAMYFPCFPGWGGTIPLFLRCFLPESLNKMAEPTCEKGCRQKRASSSSSTDPVTPSHPLCEYEAGGMIHLGSRLVFRGCLFAAAFVTWLHFVRSSSACIVHGLGLGKVGEARDPNEQLGSTSSSESPWLSAGYQSDWFSAISLVWLHCVSHPTLPQHRAST